MRTMIAILLVAGCHTASTDTTTTRRSGTVATNEESVITVTGTITNEGAECPAMRDDNGKLYTIARPVGQKLTPGMRVRVTGTIATVSTCMQGTTIAATKIEELPAPR